jgi:hypothetical protein
MPDRAITCYLAIRQLDFDVEELIAFFQQCGYGLHYPETSHIKGFSDAGEPVSYNRNELIEAIRLRPSIGFSVWKDKSDDIYCTLRFRSQCTILGIELRGTTLHEQVDILSCLMQYLIRQAADRRLLGFVGDFEDMIENGTDSGSGRAPSR